MLSKLMALTVASYLFVMPSALSKHADDLREERENKMMHSHKHSKHSRTIASEDANQELQRLRQEVNHLRKEVEKLKKMK